MAGAQGEVGDRAGAASRLRLTCAVVLSLAGAEPFVTGPLLPWIGFPADRGVYFFGLLPGNRSGQTSTFPVNGLHLRGLASPTGQVVLDAGLALVVLTGVLLLVPAGRRFSWLVAVPGVVVAGAVGHWHRQPGSSPLLHIGYSLVPLIGVPLAALAAGLWPARATVRQRVPVVGFALVAAVLACGVFATVVGARGDPGLYFTDHYFSH